MLLAGGAQLPHGKAREPKQAEVMVDLFWRMMQRVDSLEKTLMLGGIGGRRRRG